MPLWPLVQLRVSEYPPEGTGGLTIVETVLADDNGPLDPEPLTYGVVYEGITEGSSESAGDPHIWTHGIQLGRHCVGERGTFRIGVYFLDPDGVEASKGWKKDEAVTLPPGSVLLDEVTVERRDTEGPCTDPT